MRAVKRFGKIFSSPSSPMRVPLAGGASAEIRISPNMPGKQQPPAKWAKPVLPLSDMDRLFSLLRKVEKAIFSLVFMPSRGGANSVVSEAIALGLNDTSFNVVGAISDTQAMWGCKPRQELPNGKRVPAWSPHILQQAGISVIRATALAGREIGRAVGDFKNYETLTLRAIIHDKVLVIEKCVVAFGSHNLGYKASYSNDENLAIVEGMGQSACLC